MKRKTSILHVILYINIVNSGFITFYRQMMETRTKKFLALVFFLIMICEKNHSRVVKGGPYNNAWSELLSLMVLLIK